MNWKALRRWLPYVIVLVFLACISFLAGNRWSQPAVAKAQEAAVLGPDGGGNCTIDEIAVYESRVHVRCQPGVGGIGATIYFFARPSDEDIHVTNRMLSLLITSEALGRHPYITWDNNSAHNPPGCGTTDCRRLLDVRMP